MQRLQEYWEKRYVPEKWILETMSLSKRVYDRYRKLHCKTEQIRFLPQNLSPVVFETILQKCKEGVPYVTIAQDLALEERQVRKIICKLQPYYGIRPLSKPRYIPTSDHRQKLGELLTEYNKTNPKKKEQNPNWKGGITELCELIRRMNPYRAWRKQILSRDGFKCIVCDSSESLQVDHIYPFSLLLEEGKITTIEQAENYAPLWNVSNGRVMCETCHRKTETYGKQRKNK